MLSAMTILKIGLEITLGLCMKLFIENGRIHPADFMNDYLFWLPGVEAEDAGGIERQVQHLLGPVVVEEPVFERELPLAAK